MMKSRRTSPKSLRRMALAAAVAVPVTMLVAPLESAYAGGVLAPGNLLVSTSVWTTTPNITAGVTQLPPGCSTATGAADPCLTAIAGSSYPQVFNNAPLDSSFGVTQPIVLDELNPTSGAQIASVTVPHDLPSGSDQLVTSFSSKSEVALNQSTDGDYVTFMGYVSPTGAIDVSNSNTPGVVDPTNSAGPNAVYRAVAQLDTNGNFQYTETNAYSGNNGRAAILDTGNNTIYTAGNAGNGAKPEYSGVISGAGSQLLTPANAPESAQTPGQPTPYGNFNAAAELGVTDKTAAKDNNYRGLALYNNVIYLTKGSGSNGVDTVYFVDTTGSACPKGVGLPSSSATLPAASSYTSPTVVTSGLTGLSTTNPGLSPVNVCVLSGFPTVSAGSATQFPFGLWFANPTTLYVADEGSGTNTYSATTGEYTAAAASTTAGLDKYTLNTATGTWQFDYALQGGLNLGQPYIVPSYPTGNNSYTVSGTTTTGPWAPATDGLRNITGQVNANGTVTIWATTSTVSFSGDQGADPNALVSVTDNLSATSAPSGETFSTVMAPTSGQVIRGVSFTPGTGSAPSNLPEVPWAPIIPLSFALLGGGYLWRRSHGHRSVILTVQ